MTERVMDSRDYMRGWIEQDAIDARPDHDGQIRLSVAVSLKRIADALTGAGVDDLVTGLHGTLTNLAWEMGRSFQHGTRTDR